MTVLTIKGASNYENSEFSIDAAIVAACKYEPSREYEYTHTKREKVSGFWFWSRYEDKKTPIKGSDPATVTLVFSQTLSFYRDDYWGSEQVGELKFKFDTDAKAKKIVSQYEAARAFLTRKEKDG